MSPADTVLLLDQVRCEYDGRPVVDGVQMRVREGEIFCLLGPSGCGKTTLLRAIAGLEPISSGEIRLRGNTVSAPSHTIPPDQRRIGMVFQDYALFPHLNVRQNVAFGLSRAERTGHSERIDHLLDLVGLADTGDRYPHELSGGQQQRIAIARALAPQPSVLLLDEPFSNLDVALRARLLDDVYRIIQAEGLTAILVTHDQQEAFAVADHVAVIANGRIEQTATPYELYHEPASRFVAEFVGLGTFIAATVLDARTLQTALGPIRTPVCLTSPTGTRVELLLRPDDFRIHPTGDAEGVFTAQICRKRFQGAETLYELDCDNISLFASFPSHNNFDVNDTLYICPDLHHLILF